MTNWYYLVACCVVLASLIIRLEWKRKNNRYFIWRTFATLLGISSLLALAIPHFFETAGNSSNKIIIVTRGVIPDSLQKFQEQQRSSVPVYSTNRDQPGLSFQWIPDLSRFLELHAPDTVHVFGYGFSSDELTALNDRPIIFHPPPSRSSLISADWKKQLKQGEPLAVQGQFNNEADHEINLFLQAFGQPVDSVQIAAKTKQAFSLATTPRHLGKAIYSLMAVSGTDTIENEPVPLLVEPAPLMNIFFLASAPGFENTMLKNRLAQQGYGIAMRTTVSSHKSDLQFLNMPKQQADRVTSLFLRKFDLIIADEQALQEMGASDLSAIRNAVEKEGLGLLVKLSGKANTAAFYSALFPVNAINGQQKAITIFTGVPGDSNYILPVSEQVSIRDQPGQRVLLQDAQSHIYASLAAFGTGKITGITFENSFTLALAGHDQSYLSLWSHILQPTAKKQAGNEAWDIYPSVTFVNNAVQIRLTNSDSGRNNAQIGMSKVQLQPDQFLPGQWSGTYWPRDAGWQTLIQLNGELRPWYLFGGEDWQKPADAQTARATGNYVLAHPLPVISETASGGKAWKKGLFFFLLFIFAGCSTYLWITEKTR